MKKNVSDTCQTRDRHVSRVWDHDHWIPGKILTCLHVNYFPVAHLERELGFKPTKNKEGGPKKTKGFCKKLKSLLYTNMTLTKPLES